MQHPALFVADPEQETCLTPIIIDATSHNDSTYCTSDLKGLRKANRMKVSGEYDLVARHLPSDISHGDLQVPTSHSDRR